MGNLLNNWDISRWIRLVSGVGEPYQDKKN